MGFRSCSGSQGYQKDRNLLLLVWLKKKWMDLA
jgi:hypothetical protein